MKLPWFCHTNSVFCNCPLFVTALVPGLFFGGKSAKTCCHSVVASKCLKTQSVGTAGRKYYNLNTNTVQRLKNNELEEQCINHALRLNQVFSPHDYDNIMDHFGKLMELSTNTSMAAFVEPCRLVYRTRIIVDQ